MCGYVCECGFPWRPEGVLDPLELVIGGWATWCGCLDLSSVLHRSSKCQLVIHFSSPLPHIRILRLSEILSREEIITREKVLLSSLTVPVGKRTCKACWASGGVRKGDSQQPVCRSCAHEWPLDYLLECWSISEGPAIEQGNGERLNRKDYPEGPLGTCLGEDDFQLEGLCISPKSPELF